jgi:hypothetical protein
VDASRKPEDQAASQAENEVDPDVPTPDGEDDDYSDVPFVKHPRFRKVLAERRDFKARAEKAEHGADQFNKVQSFMDSHGLTAEEAGSGLMTFALAKTNPVEAWKQAKPWVQKLLMAAGEHPEAFDDLKKRMDSGEIDRNTALEISRNRATTHSVKTTQSFQEQRRQKQAEQQTSSDIHQAAIDWAEDRNVKDPNFAAKVPLIEREVAYLQRKEGVPNTPEGVKAQLKKAYDAVKLPAAVVPTSETPRPQKKAITPIRSGTVAGGTTPEINSTMDVLKARMAKRA